MINLEKARTTAIRAAKEAGLILLKHYKKPIKYRRKGPIDFVSEVDLKAEKIIISKIKKDFPLHSIHSEECGTIDKGSEYMWYIDPLDGTHNYIHGVTPFGVSIALTKGKEVLVGVIDIPLEKETYWAVKGKGAFLNGKQIRVSKRGKNDAMVSFTTRIRQDPKKKTDMLMRFAEEFEMMRSHGSISQTLAWLAAGNVDIVVTFTLPAHDMAAGYVIVKEAGGRITDFAGKTTDFMNGQFILSNSKLHNIALKLTRRKK